MDYRKYQWIFFGQFAGDGIVCFFEKNPSALGG